MTYSETLLYLDSFINYEKLNSYPYKEAVKLERLAGFLKAIGDPQLSLKCVHVAGTKGKGSTAVFIAYILREAGYRTGLYTSPHLSNFRERIRLLLPSAGTGSVYQEGDFEGMIPEEKLSSITSRLKPAIEDYNKDLESDPLSFFEVYTAIAFLYFLEEKADYVVLETGLGGRLDATNTVDSFVSVITPVSLEHTQKLGSTVKEIAAEKAGIIKKAQPVISALQEEEAEKVIMERCRSYGAKLYRIGRDITYSEKKDGFDLRGIKASYESLKIRLVGGHQLMNASVAVAAVEALSLLGAIVSPGAIRSGLNKASWPARCEAVSRDPLVILDGAQNVASARAIKEAVKKYFTYKKLILVLGISSDKDIKGVCLELKALADEVILTKADNPRAALPEELSGYFTGKPVYLTRSIKEARGKAYSLCAKDDLILVCGSLFVAGEFRDEIKLNS